MRKSFTYRGIRYYIRAKDEVDYEVKKALKIQEIDSDVLIESKMIFESWANKWLETYKINSVSTKTYNDYKQTLNKYILPYIGKLRLKDIKSIHIQEIMQNANHLSQSRINKIHQAVCQALEKAVANELIGRNPAKYVEKPKGTSGSHRSITPEERAVILKVATYHKHGLWIKLMLYCGLRTGETARVKLCHFDFDKNLLYIDGTKTKNARRTVPVPADLMQEIKYLNKNPFDYLFTNEHGVPIKPHNRGRMWKSFKKAMHIEMGGKTYRDQVIPPYMVADDLCPYCLRHTFCTDLQDAGVPINVAKDLMGHSDISLTASIYTHTTDKAISDAADKLNQLRNIYTQKIF